MNRVCLNCENSDIQHTCMQCSSAHYCSRECQLAQLKTHGCKPMKRYIDAVNERQWNIYDRYMFQQDFNGKMRVLRKERLVYKFCKTEQEYLETCIFYENHQDKGIVPTIITVDDPSWVIVTYLVEDGYVLLGNWVERRTTYEFKEMLQYALIIALSKFKENAFGLDSVANLNNIGYNSAGTGAVIFFENNGKVYRYDSKSEMIFQFLQLLKFKEPRMLNAVWSEEVIKWHL